MSIDPEKLWPKDQPENPREWGASSEYEKAKKDAINETKKLESELAQKLEDHESHRETQEAEELMKKTDYPQTQPEGNNTPEQKELQRMFEAIKTDHIDYPFFRRVFPNFIRVCESSRLGQNLPRDIVALALGIGESLVSVVKLSGHLLIDTVKVVFQPRKSYWETREIVS